MGGFFDESTEKKNPDNFGCYEVESKDGQTFLLKWIDGRWRFFGNQHIEVPDDIAKLATKLFRK